MYFYQFHIGDYLTSTGHLSNEEDLAYRRLIDLYYMTEKPIPLDLVPVARKIKSTVEIIERLISDKLLIKQHDGYHNRRCDEEIAKYKSMVKGGKEGADKRWGRDRGAIGGASVGDSGGNHPLMPNHEPRTNNHEPIENTVPPTAAPRTTRFQKPTLEEISKYCRERDNGVDPERFANFYESNGWRVGKNPMKDWRAAVRTWEKGLNGAEKKKPIKPDYKDEVTFDD